MAFFTLLIIFSNIAVNIAAQEIFQIFHNKKFDNAFNLKKLEENSLINCIQKCYLFNSCNSVNFNEANFICEFFNITVNTNDGYDVGYLVDDENWKHAMINTRKIKDERKILKAETFYFNNNTNGIPIYAANIQSYDLTMCLWFKLDIEEVARYSRCLIAFPKAMTFETYDPGDCNNFLICVISNKIKIYRGSYSKAFDITINEGTWYHLCVIMSNGNEFTVYINGKLKAQSVAIGNSYIFTSTAVAVGIDLDLTPTYCKLDETEYIFGLISEFYAWNNALNSEDISEIYTNTTIPVDNLIFSWFYFYNNVQIGVVKRVTDEIMFENWWLN